MASNFYAINKGANPLLGSSITVGTSSSAGSDFELRVLTTNTPLRLDVIMALEVFKKYILSNGLDGADPSSAKGGTDLPPL